jgi:hypothetical protein
LLERPERQRAVEALGFNQAIAKPPPAVHCHLKAKKC